MARTPIRCFYQKNTLVTLIKPGHGASLFRADNRPLAQKGDQRASMLLGIDMQNSTIVGVNPSASTHYHPYGATPNDSPFLLGFNGEYRGCVSNTYLLGKGYRSYSPPMMRFQSPDSLSPFLQGGINAYAYCNGDPMNRSDPTGHNAILVQNLNKIGRFIGKQLKKSVASLHRTRTNPASLARGPRAMSSSPTELSESAIARLDYELLGVDIENPLPAALNAQATREALFDLARNTDADLSEHVMIAASKASQVASLTLALNGHLALLAQRQASIRQDSLAGWGTRQPLY